MKPEMVINVLHGGKLRLYKRLVFYLCLGFLVLQSTAPSPDIQHHSRFVAGKPKSSDGLILVKSCKWWCRLPPLHLRVALWKASGQVARHITIHQKLASVVRIFHGLGSLTTLFFRQAFPRGSMYPIIRYLGFGKW